MEKRSTRDNIVVVLGGMLLSMNAGYMNASTMLQEHPTATTHMTGNCTKLGYYFAVSDNHKIFFYAGLIICYVAGAFIAGCLIPLHTFSTSLQYSNVFFCVAILLAIAATIDDRSSERDYAAFDFLVAGASGLQNGMVSRSALTSCNNTVL
jgi:uncharacterized membrane protein YoaK (UPF0700 family)